MKFTCHNLISTSILLVFTICQLLQLVSTDDSFPNIFQHLLGKDRFRFYYELNWFDKNNQSLLSSKLVDESYSFSSNSGRILVNNGITPKQTNDYSIFFWFSSPKLQESFWLRPFICPSVRKEASAHPSESGMLFAEDQLYEMLTFKGNNNQDLETKPNQAQFILQGLSALLANVAQHHVQNLKRIENLTDLEMPDDDNDEKSKQVRWLLDTNLGAWLEFTFHKWDKDEELSFAHIVGSRIIVFKSAVNDGKKEPGYMMAQLTVLKASYLFPDQLVRLPRGYSCHYSGFKPPFTLTNPPLTTDALPKYTIEVTVTTGSDTGTQTGGSEPKLRLHEPQSIPKPSDSMSSPETNSSAIVLIVDRKDNTLSVITRLSSGTKTLNIKQQERLSVWDLNTNRYHKLSNSQCKGPIEFKSSLQLATSNNEPPPPEPEGAGCTEDNEQVVVQLSENLAVRLTSNGLKWLTFELQNRQNSAQLVDIVVLDPVKGEYEVNYEASARNLNLCLFYLDSKRMVGFASARLSTRFHYSQQNSSWLPKSSSLQFFDTTQSRLLVQVDLKIVHQAQYKPWISEHQLIDLSSCKKAARQSAKLLLEYPLDHFKQLILNQTHQPHETIRSNLAHYLKTNYFVTLTRLPSIKVEIKEDGLRIEAHLLDQIHLLHDSVELEAINSKNVTTAQYLDWLSLATRSVLVNNLQSCAEYCQLYRCEVYVFCKYSISCYIYSATAISSSNVTMPQPLASYHGLEMDCAAYRVLPHRSEVQVERRRANVWSLEEILESVQQSVNDPISNEPKRSSNITSPSGRADLLDQVEFEETPLPIIQVYPNFTDGSISAELFELQPIYAHYQFDNPNQHFQDSGSLLNPFISIHETKQLFDNDNEKSSLRPEVQINPNFRVALAGHQLVEKNDLSVVKNYDQLQHLDLDYTSDGYLSIYGLSLDECLRICLADAACASTSYCSTTNSNCLVSRLNSTGLSRLTIAKRFPNPRVQNLTQQSDLLSRIELQENAACTIMMRTYSDQFERLELKMLFTYADQPLDDVLSITQANSPEECATKCVTEHWQTNNINLKHSSGSVETCLSYDFCQPLVLSDEDWPTASCILYKRHLVSKSEHLKMIQGDFGKPEVTIKKSNSSSARDKKRDVLSALKEDMSLDLNSYCWHYVRNFMSDFHKINGRRLSSDMRSLNLRNFNLPELDKELDSTSQDLLKTPTIDGSDISLARCARLCEEDSNCGAFEYCALSHREVPGGLYLSCSLGSNETLAMIPIHGSNKHSSKPPQRYMRDMLKLARHRFCSVYIYRALSLVAGHKKKNLLQYKSEISSNDEEVRRRGTKTRPNFLLDLIIFGLFFLFGSLIYSFNFSQISYIRSTLNRFNYTENEGINIGYSSRQRSGSRVKIWPTKKSTADIYSDEFDLETIGTTVNESSKHVSSE